MAKPSDFAPSNPASQGDDRKTTSISIFPARIVAHGASCAPIVKALATRATMRAANDNGGAGYTFDQARPGNDHVLHAALRHFAQHGIGAAREARAQAEKAFFLGDRQAYDWWIGITRTLDRRLAAEAERAAT